jgi:glutathione S-transferase
LRLIGMLDSPYVRRVAVSLKFLGLPFEHESVSVFRHYEAFAAINPVVKAPTLVTDDETVLLDSSLILEYLDRLAPPDHRLVPDGLTDFARAQRIVGLALAACEKTVQLVYEATLRPTEKQHQPWVDRVLTQLLAAYRLLEKEVGSGQTWIIGDRPLQADISAAVAWRFTQYTLPDRFATANFPALARLSSRAEALEEFFSTPLATPLE